MINNPVSTVLNFGVEYTTFAAKFRGQVSNLVSGRSASSLSSTVGVFAPCVMIFSFWLPRTVQGEYSSEQWMKGLIKESLNSRRPSESAAYYSNDTHMGMIRLVFPNIEATNALSLCQELENKCLLKGGNIN